MARLTKQLLVYAQIGSYHFEIIPFNDFIKECYQLVKHSFNPRIHVEMDLPINVSSVKADPTQLQMVFSATLTNASEALDGKGEIRISVKDVEIGEAFVNIDPEIKPGLYVCLALEDNGKGMDAETKKKIFDPFFSTKFYGRGLSMAAVYGIVKNHLGTISIESEPGKGTVVRVYLPACQNWTYSDVRG